MADIKKRGEFDFLCQTPSYRKVHCFFKDGRRSLVDFDKLQITYTGTVRAWAESEDKFVTLSQILPVSKSDDEYFTFISSEINRISQKRKVELKQQQKEKKDRRKMTA